MSAFANFQNLDLLSVGVAVAGMIILGLVTLLNNPKNASNRALFFLAITASIWGVLNYASYQGSSASVSFTVLKCLMFFAVLSAFATFLLAYVFPAPKIVLIPFLKWLVIPLTGITALLTLTPFVFSEVTKLEAGGGIAEITNGPGMALFGLTITFLNFGAVILLVRKILRLPRDQRRPMQIVLFGMILMLTLIMIFNFIFPAFLDNNNYIPLGALFLFPFVALTAYAMLKHHLLGIKVIATETITFVLAIVTLAEVVFAETLVLTIFRSGVFLLILSLGTVLIRAVRREVEQREKLEILTKQLENANERLKELDVQKSQFLSFASHDLKSPINIIKQFASLIADGTYKEPAKIKETVDKIKTTADRAVNLVDDFLDIRKIEEGKMDYNFETKDIVSFVKGVTEDYAPVAKAQKNIAVSFETKIASANVKMDTTRFRQVIQNLLSNSLKYTESGWIKVKIAEEQKSILISVQDSGIGMDAPLLPVLFEQFRRDPGVAKKIQGTGLGLYISKQIVLGHGGEIWASSEGKGHGSTFYVRMKKI